MIPKHRSARIIGLAVLLGACLGIAWDGTQPRSAGPGPSARKAGSVPIYLFDPRADTLLKEMFPPKVRISGLTNAYLDRGRSPRFAELDTVFEYHSQAMQHAQDGPEWWDVPDDSLESAWLGDQRQPDWQRPLLLRAKQVADLAGGLASPARPFGGPLEKALFQRDLLQMCMIFQEAASAEQDAKLRTAGERAVQKLATLWQRQWLTEAEYQALIELRPQQIAAASFVPTTRFALSQDYLPARVLADEPGWYAMSYGSKASQHFRAFAGRSFIRIYLKPPGWTQAQFFRYWDAVADKFGAGVTRNGSVPSLPAGTQTLLVRTFGVFLKDGSCADSGYPEEVLMRLFKHEQTQLDLATSDYRGTLLYRYQMRRRGLLADVRTLGLQRVHDDEPQFFGFLSDVPDHQRAYSATLTTMRNNCISCHSEALYGASTVFSLAHKRRGRKGQERLEGGLLQPTGKDGRFLLHTAEFKALQLARRASEED